jgi:predicted RNA-binding Zn ribbon-like protein
LDMSEWSASHRYGLAPAPGGLGLVQDFLNTIRIQDYGPDLLADVDDARAWVAGAVRTWAPLRGLDAEDAEHAAPPALHDGDLAKLRALRDTIAKLVAGQPPDSREIGAIAGATGPSTSFALSDTGEVRLVPAGSGWRWLASALLGEIMVSQQEDTWRRLKRCHRHGCDSTFYDRSKNNSGVWHNVKTCGNSENLRASRARRRERERAAGSAASPAQPVPSPQPTSRT